MGNGQGAVTDSPALARVDVLAVGYADTPSVAGTVGLVRDGNCVIVVDPGMVRSRSLILDPIDRLGLTPDDVTHVFVSHHHLDHTVNIALFRHAEIVDFRTVRRDDHVEPHAGDGWHLAPHTTIWVTPGHTPQDASLVVDTVDGVMVVDTGMPGNADRILACAERFGRAGGIRYIVLTHSDMDHVGSAARLKELTGAAVAIHWLDAPVLAGTEKSAKGGRLMGALRSRPTCC